MKNLLTVILFLLAIVAIAVTAMATIASNFAATYDGIIAPVLIIGAVVGVAVLYAVEKRCRKHYETLRGVIRREHR